MMMTDYVQLFVFALHCLLMKSYGFANFLINTLCLLIWVWLLLKFYVVIREGDFIV